MYFLELPAAVLHLGNGLEVAGGETVWIVLGPYGLVGVLNLDLVLEAVDLKDFAFELGVPLHVVLVDAVEMGME